MNPKIDHIGVRELKSNATRIVRAVREEQAEFVVTVRGQPVAVIRPYSVEDDERIRQAQNAAFLAQLDELAQEMARYHRDMTILDQLQADRSEPDGSD